MENQKEKNNIWLIVLLVLIILGLVGYICYDKLLNKKCETNSVEKLGNNEKKYSNYIKDAKINYEDDKYISYELDGKNQYVNKEYIIYDKTVGSYLNEKYNMDDYTIVYFGKIENVYYYFVFSFIDDVHFKVDIYNSDGVLLNSLKDMTYEKYDEDNESFIFIDSPNTVAEKEFIWKPTNN